MESWLIGLITTVCGIVLTFTVTKICESIYHRTKHYKELKEKEDLEKIEKATEQALDKKFNKISTQIDELNDRIDQLEEKMDEKDAKLNAGIDKLSQDLALVKEGDQASLRNILYRVYNEGKAKGFSTIEEKENFNNLYDKYHKLGANGVMDGTYKKYMSLPSEKTEKKKNRLNE